MTQIDFYLLGSSGQNSKEGVACRLTEKAFRAGHQVCLLTESENHSHKLDQLLWTFKAGSFIPHEISENGSNDHPELPVIITHQDPPDNLHDVLISLNPETPSCFSRFNRLAEVVEDSDNSKQQARERYRYYRDRGYPLNTHEL